MSESLLSADRNTHLKIAAVALIAVAVMIFVGFTARTTSSDLVAVRGNADGRVIRAGTPVAYSDAERSTKQ